MSDQNFSYYQFRKDLNYQVYLRFDDLSFENQLAPVLDLMGFDKVERKAVKEMSFDQQRTRILKVVKATPRITRQIDRKDFSSDKYGPESLSPMGNYEVYRYQGVGMMILGEMNPLWELGLKTSMVSEEELRMIFTRFLSFALAAEGVVGFWGVPVDEGFVVMSPKSANYESIFIDLKKNVLITYDAVKPIESELQILRLDNALLNEVKGMRKEALFSFLTMNTCLLSYHGMDSNIKEAIFELSSVSKGIIYPENNFRSRFESQEA
jgi:hypothetical protein